MAFIPVASVAQVEIVNMFNSQRVQTVLHYKGGDVSDETVLTNLAGSVNALWQSEIAPLISENVNGSLVAATDISSESGPSVEVTNSVNGSIVVGTSPSLPNSIAWSLKKATELRGKNYRGRIYHYGFTEAQVAYNAVDATVASNVAAAWNEFVSFTNGDATWVMQVVSRYDNNAPRVSGIATPVVAITYADRTIDSQRRRLPGRGS